MKHRRPRRGVVLIEMLVGAVVSLLVGAAAFQLMQANYDGHDTVSGQNNVNMISREQIDSLADSMRNAQCGPLHRAIGSANSNSITYYTDAAGDTERYWLDNTTSPAVLKRVRTVNGVTGAAAVLGTGISSLKFTYYPAGGWATTANPNAPTSAELPTLGAISINMEMSINGYTRTLNSLVRLRNSPYVAPSP